MMLFGLSSIALAADLDVCLAICPFQNVGAALDNAVPGDRIRVLGEVTETRSLEFDFPIDVEGPGSFTLFSAMRVRAPITLRDVTVSVGSKNIRVEPGATLTTDNVQIEGVDANTAMLIVTEGTATLRSTQMGGRQSDGEGGLINVDGGFLQVVGGRLANAVADRGSAIFSKSSDVSLRAVVVEGHDAAEGTIYLDGGTLTVTDSTLKDNVADEGGAYYGNGVATFDRVELLNNRSRSRGGAVFSTGTLAMSRSTVCGNLAVDGGGIHASGPVSMTHTVVFNNVAQRFGGAYLPAGTITNSTFAFNEAPLVAGLHTLIDPTNILITDNIGPAFSGASGSYNAWFGENTPTDGVGSVYGPFDFSTPPNCGYATPAPWSQLLDAGDPSLLDAGGGRSDIGAFGGDIGPIGLYADADSDGVTTLRDCDDANPLVGTFFVGAIDADSDGVAGADDGEPTCDPTYVELFGDCDDEDSTVLPGANDVCGDGFDSDCDGIGDDDDDDEDGDGLSGVQEALFMSDVCLSDTDGDGLGDGLEVLFGSDPASHDTDSDGVLDGLEATGDSDDDGVNDVLDDDDDGDGQPTISEGQVDSDNDGVADYLDTDDDDDGVPTLLEPAGDPDSDGLLNHLDADSDANGVLDFDESTVDADGDGLADAWDTYDFGPGGDVDLDGLSDLDEIALGSNLANPDTDGDSVPDGLEAVLGDPTDTDGNFVFDVLDTDDDGDGIPTAEEDYDGSGSVLDDDRDADGIPDYLDDDDVPLTLDEDGDGLTRGEEEALGTDRFNPDTDGDGVLDGDELPLDTDGDGVVNPLDPDDDGDGILTVDEPDEDVDEDGVASYLDPDDDEDGVVDGAEVDVDGDGFPDVTGDGSRSLEPTSGPSYGFGCTTGGAAGSLWWFALVLGFGRRRP